MKNILAKMLLTLTCLLLPLKLLADTAPPVSPSNPSPVQLDTTMPPAEGVFTADQIPPYVLSEKDLADKSEK